MNQDQLQGIWKQLTGRLKESWGQCTSDKTLTIEGRRDQLIGKLQERHGYTEANDLRSANPGRVRKLDESINNAFDSLKRDFE
jgi:uncharacterized protein YjbJ (UPF0337 family)